jgi:hypothetical protein
MKSLRWLHDIAAGDDEHPTVSQRSQFGAQVEVVIERLVSVDRQLDDRNGCVRERVYQHRPRTVIDTPAIEICAHPGRMQVEQRDENGAAGSPLRWPIQRTTTIRATAASMNSNAVSTCTASVCPISNA